MKPNEPGRGRSRLSYIDDASGLWTPAQSGWTDNAWMYTWAHLACSLFGRRDPAFGLSAAYLEFSNVANPSDAVTAPTFQKQDGLSYFEALSVSPRSDFLRIFFTGSPLIDVVPGYEAYFPPGMGNRLTVFASTGGLTAGVFGKPFSDAANSKVYGISIVATPVPGDRTQDILMSRSYYAPADQRLKLPNESIGATYEYSFPA